MKTVPKDSTEKGKQLTAVIDGCTVRLRFAPRSNEQAMELVKDALLTSYFDSLMNLKPVGSV